MDPKELNNGQSAAVIAELAKNANGISIETFKVPDGAVGLPSEIQFGFDRRASNPQGAIDLAKFAETFRKFPARRKGTAKVLTLQSFIDLTNRQKTADSVIFAATSWPELSITSIVNYHALAADGQPNFGDHRIHYPFPVTDEFTEWMDNDDEAMTQHDFAVFVEERIAEIATASDQEGAQYASLFQTTFATPADMMMLSRGLELNVASAIKGQHTLQTGEREIMFQESHTAKVTVPGLFMVSVPAFLDSDPVRLPARLRYRVTPNGIVWFYQLYRWKELLRERVVADLNTATEATTLHAYEGTPEA